MITIFTPTYNRAYALPKLYESLKKQSDNDFEWIVVDDGSKDDTETLFDEWKTKQNGFSIKYMKQENSGKHIAINTGVSLASTDWFFIVDSDDYIVENAVEKVHEWIDSCKGAEFAGLAGTKISDGNVTIGGKVSFETPYVDCKNNERRKYGLGGDKAEVYKTSILKKYPFPKFIGENFLSECSVWDQIALDGYKLRWFNSPLMVCTYLSDGLTAKINKLELENFEGYTYATKVRLKAYSGLERYRIIAQYINKGLHKRVELRKIADNIDQNAIFVFFMAIIVEIKNLILGDNVR